MRIRIIPELWTMWFMHHSWMYLGFQAAQWVKNPAMQETQETQVLSQGWEDPLEEEMATHSSILAWRIPQTKENGGLQPIGSQRVGHEWSNLACTHTGSECIGILQARILEWAAISFSRGSSQPRDRTRVSCIADRRFIIWAAREAL